MICLMTMMMKMEEIAAYNSDLQEIGADDPTDDEEDLPGNIEEDLSIIDEDE